MGVSVNTEETKQVCESMVVPLSSQLDPSFLYIREPTSVTKTLAARTIA